MTLTIRNKSQTNPLTITSFADDLSGTTLRILASPDAPADPAVNCTGTGADNGTLDYTANTENTTLSLANATAGPGGQCVITAYVTSSTDGQHTNSIPVDAVKNPDNWSSPAASAVLTTNAQLTVDKTISVNRVAPGQWTEFTVTIKNWSGAEVTNVSFLDVMPSSGASQMVLFDPGSGIYSMEAGCSGGTWTGTDSAGNSTGNAPVSGTDTGLRWSGGTIVAGIGANPGVCIIKIRAKVPNDAASGLSFSNKIDADAISGTGPGGGTVTNPDDSPAAGMTSVWAVAVEKSFAPRDIPRGGLSTLTLRIRNRTVSPLSSVNLTDVMPSGITLAANPAPTNSCGGTLTANPLANSLTLSGGSIAARPDAAEDTSCTITVKVTGNTEGSYTNTLAPGDFSSSAGTFQNTVQDTLTISAGLTATKAFSPTQVTSGGASRVSIQVTNRSNTRLTNVSLTDPLNGGLVIANPARAASSCSGSPSLVVNPGETSAQMLGATLASGASCSFSFDVKTSGSGPWTNTIPVVNITSAEGVSNTESASSTLGVLPGAINIVKSFNPIIVTGGVPSTLSLTLTNPTGAVLHDVGFTDVFPEGIQVYSVPAITSTCSGGTVSAAPGAGQVSLTGATLAPNSSCAITLQTTSVKYLNLTNNIPAGAVRSQENYTNPSLVSATLSTLQGLGVMKGFEPAYVVPNAVTKLKMWLVSTFDPNAPVPQSLTGVSYTDTLPDGLVVADPNSASTTCVGTGTDGKAEITANVGSNLVTVSKATIAPGTNCLIEVDVKAPDTLGTYTNTIPKESITTIEGVTNPAAANASLHVVDLPTLAKGFSPATVNIGETSTLTVTINNGASIPLTGVSLVDNLPPGLAIAPTPAASTTCAGGLVTANPGEETLAIAGATVPANGSCTFQSKVVALQSGDYANTIPIGTLISNEVLSNSGAASNTLTVRPPVSISKAFSPVSIAKDGTSTLTLTLDNTSAAAITLTSALVDALPAGLLVADDPSIGGTCTGTVTATAGSSTITYANGATIPAGGCTIAVDVTASASGVLTNIIAAGQLTTTAGKNQDPAVASLGVDRPAPPTVAKAFSPSVIQSGDTATLTLTLSNPNTTDLILSEAFVDTLPDDVTVTGLADPAGTCPVTATWNAYSVTYPIGANIPSGDCTIRVNVTSNSAGSYTNEILAGALKVSDGASGTLSNVLPATAGLVVEAPVPPTVLKSFSPGTINPGGTSRLTITLGNGNDSSITVDSFTDNLSSMGAGNVTITTPAATTSCDGGTLTATAGTQSITYSGGTIPANSTCTISVNVTSAVQGGPWTNTIDAGGLQTSAGNNGAAATANLFVNPPQPPSLSKSFTPPSILVNGTSTLTLSFGNGNNAGTTLDEDLVDTLPSGIKVAADPNIRVSAGCTEDKVVAEDGAGTVTYQTGGAIPAGGCSVSVDVTSSVLSEDGHLNSIAAGALKTGYGDSAVKTEARLKVTELAVDKSVSSGSGPYAIGDLVTYKVTVTVPPGLNGQPFVANGVTITDTLPTGLAYIADTFTLGSHENLTIQTESPTPDTADNKIVANFGSVTNATSASQTFDVTYQVRVLDVESNKVATPPENAVALSTSDTTEEWTANASMTLGEPALSLTKAMSPTADLKAGDTVTITLTATNTGSVPAYGIKVTDVLNDGADNVLFDLTTANIANTSTDAGLDDYVFAYDENTGTVTYTAKDEIRLAANGGSVTFTFTATVSDTIISGWTYSNTASVEGNSQNDPAIGRSVGPTNSNTVTTGATVTGAVTKTIAATSESWTADANVAIGEIITYRLAYTIPRGITRSPTDSAIFTDTLPVGLQFQTGKARIWATAENAVTIAKGDQVTDVNDDGVLPTTATAVTPTLDGQQLQFDLGDIQSMANDAQVIITFDALVLNTGDNNRGNTKTNTAALNYLNRDNATQSQTGTHTTTTIVESNPAVTKTADPTTASGGKTVTFTVVASNPTGANVTRVWEPELRDVLSDRFQNPAVTSAVLSRDSTSLGEGCHSVSDQTLTLNLACLDSDQSYLAPGETITLTYTATLDANVSFEESVTNTVAVSGTSLPGTKGTDDAAPGEAGSETGERTGSSNPEVNDLAASDTATVTANRPSISKTVDDDSLQIGETAMVTLTVSVPVGQTGEFKITDNLPTGLRYTGQAITITLPVSDFTASNSPSITPGAGTDPLVFDFGTVQNSAAVSQNIVIEYQVQVENSLANQRNTELKNTATLTYTGAAEPYPTATDTITVREPSLVLAKTITSGEPATAGSEVGYQLTVTNTDAHATAYRVNLADVLPAELQGANGGVGPFFYKIEVTNPGDSVVASIGSTALTASDADQGTSNTLTWPLFDLPPNTTLTIDYKAQVIATAAVGATLTNNVAADYHSLADGGGDGRNGTDIKDDTDNTKLNNYGQTTSRGLTLDKDIVIQKSLTAGQTDANFAIGEEVQFDLKVSVLPGVTNNVVVTDTLPDGLAFVELVAPVAGDNISYTGTASAVESPLGTITIDMGDVTNTPDEDTTNDHFILHLKARVKNIAGNQNNVTLTNSAEVTSAIGNDTDTLDITVVEPVLQVTKTPDPLDPALGSSVTYTVTVSHAVGSQADAYAVTLSDLIPDGLTYVPDSASGPVTVDATDPENPVFTLGGITQAESSKEFSYRVTVDLAAVVGQPLTNTISGAFQSTSSATGAADSGRTGPLDAGDTLNDYSFTGQTNVTPSTNAVIAATKTVSIATGGDDGKADPGDTLEYTVVLTNTSGSEVKRVIFTDPIPANTAYVGGSTKLNGETSGSVSESSVLRVDVGTLGTAPANNTATITFQVTINANVPAGTVISNQGSVDSDQTVPEPTDADGNDANGDQPTTITVGGAPSLDNALYVEKLVEWSLDSDSNGAVTPGDTLTYTLVLANRGDEELTGVTLSDDLPDGLSYVAYSAGATPGTVTVSAGSLNLTGVSIPVGGYAFVWFEVTINDFNADASPKTFTNQATADSDQTDPVRSDGNGDPSDGNQPTSITAVSSGPGTSALDVEKRWSLAVDVDGDGRVDPGDTLAYRISVRNSGSAQATDVRLSDPIPDKTSLVAGSVTTSQGVVVSEGDPIEVNLGTLSAGTVATVGFRVTVDGGTPDGTLIANQASLTAAGDITEQSDDNGTDDDGKNPTLTPVDTEGVSGTPSGLTKTLTDSSETDSTGANLMVGEVATFQIEVAFPAGTLRQATLSDTLPTGLNYVPGTARLARTFNTFLNAERNPGDINGADSGVFVDLEDSELDFEGQTLSLPLGDVINSDSDVNDETYTLEYQAVVANITDNDAGDTLTNSATLSYLNALNQPRSLTSVTHTATVIEPAVQIEKSASPAAVGQFGGEMTFTVTLTNPSSSSHVATAYDVQLLDTLPANYSNLQVVSQTPAGEPAPQGITDSSGASKLDISVAVLPPDASLTIVYRATAAAGLALDTDITNTAKATWTSLPGLKGTNNATPGNPGEANGERTGSKKADDDAANDYAAEDDAVVTVGDLSFTKSIVDAQTHYAIGETVTYRLEIDLLPDAGPANTAIQDQLDAGLTYVAGSLSIALDNGVTKTGAATDFTRQDNEPSDGLETLSLDLGALANASGGVAGVTLTYRARVDNLLDNQDGETRDNAARLTFNNPSGEGQRTLEGSTTLTLGEPELSLDKTITSPTTNLDAGDRIDFQVKASNVGTTTAQDVVLTDVLPSGLETVTNLAIVATAGGAEAPTFVNDGSGWRTNPFRLPVGASVTLSFSARLANSVLPDQSLQNRVTASFSSLEGESEHERDGSDPGSEQTDGTLNNYNTSDASPVVTVANPIQIDKTFHPDATKTTYTIGENVDYRLKIELSEGRIDDMVVTDTLPDGLRFLRATLGLGNTGIQTNDAAPTQSGQALEFDLGDVANPADGRTDNDFITLDIQAVVEDVPANVNGAILGNHANVAYRTATGAKSQDFDANGDEPGPQPLELDIIEPALVLEKTIDTELAELGSEVEFSLTLAHSAESQADAYDLVITDRLPEGLTYVPGSATRPVSIVDDTLVFEIDALTQTDQRLEIRFRAQVDIAAEPGSRLTNRATVAYDSRPGESDDERDYADEASVDLEVSGERAGDLLLRKTVYQGHNQGAGCPGVKELTIVDKYREPKPMTWCFRLTNVGQEALAYPLWDDAPLFRLKPGSAQTPMTLRAGSAMPLQPGETAWYYVEEMRDSSLVNSVTVTMTPVEADGSPIPNAEPVTASDSSETIFGYVFDPPFGVKTGQVEGQDIVRWTMVWVNDNVVRANGVFITDPPPEGMTLYGAPTCTPYGSTTVDSCGFEAPSPAFPRGRVLVRANFGPDFGVTIGTIGQAANRLEIAFDVLVDSPEVEETYENQGTAEWTPPGVDETLETKTYDETQLDEIDPEQPISELDPDEIPPIESTVDPWARADLRLTKTINDDRLRIGQQITFTVRVLNQGPNRATGVRVFDPLPSGYDLMAATSSQGRYDPETGYWRIGTLEVGDAVELRVIATVRAEGEYANRADVDGKELDPVLDDNSDSVTPTLVVPPPSPNPIPTLSEWALILLMLSMLALALHFHRARPRS